MRRAKLVLMHGPLVAAATVAGLHLTASPAVAPAVHVPARAARVHCDRTVGSRGALEAAVARSASRPRTVCVRSGEYGSLRLHGRHRARVTLRPARGASPKLGEVALDGVSRLRVTGFRFSRGGFSTESSRADRVAIVGNRFENYTGSALMLWSGDSHITFARNLVRNLNFDGSWESGWGISAIGGRSGIHGLVVRRNSFIHTEQDAMEIGGTFDGRIVANVIKDVHPPAGTDAHTDSLMLWDGSRRFLIKDNRFTDGHGLLLSGSTSDVRLENNLIVRMANWCQDAGPTGSSSAGVVRYTWVHNTIYDCGSYWNSGGFGGDYGFGSLGPVTDGASNRASHNLVTSFDVSSPRQFAYEDYNVIVHGPTHGPHDVHLRPHFRDRRNYQATNLPFKAGYRPVPAGYPGRIR